MLNWKVIHKNSYSPGNSASLCSFLGMVSSRDPFGKVGCKRDQPNEAAS